ncbi:zona pellucida sperm-binding protein 3-like isoform X2 [Seriola aureovittata]|uniref:zona pellucida sperm-binding protein 3-like isoform X2 n=1 Tax=Seriola aureovittata TaxID=2871759 RepID=UPI0024BEE80A|nr:zona pellucida sperm-binding protein 3-like isoform X2 [Seriola aureovittata]
MQSFILYRREPTSRGVEAQRPAQVEARPTAEPEREHSRESAQPAGGLQVKVYPELEPLSWRFPQAPVDQVKKPPVRFERRRPETWNRVAVRCGESGLQVEVSQDLLGLGRLVEPEHITLGGCSATEVDDLSHVIVFESELHGCNSTLVMTENTFIYAFSLVYAPPVSSRSPITRSQRAAVGVECHYPR